MLLGLVFQDEELSSSILCIYLYLMLGLVFFLSLSFRNIRQVSQGLIQREFEKVILKVFFFFFWSHVFVHQKMTSHLRLVTAVYVKGGHPCLIFFLPQGNAWFIRYSDSSEWTVLMSSLYSNCIQVTLKPTVHKSANPGMQIIHIIL